MSPIRRFQRSQQHSQQAITLSSEEVEELESLHRNCPIVGELLDVHTRNTVEENPSLTAMADFVVVNDVAARLMATVADRREIASVLQELLGPSGQVKLSRCHPKQRP